MKSLKWSDGLTAAAEHLRPTPPAAEGRLTNLSGSLYIQKVDTGGMNSSHAIGTVHADVICVQKQLCTVGFSLTS